MCKGDVLRFCCRHGLLMNVTACAWPCPQLQIVNMKSVQPFKCYKCQHRLSTVSSASSTTSADASCASSFDSLESSTSVSSMSSMSSLSSLSSAGSRPSSMSNKSCNSLATIKERPAVVRTPTGVAQYCRKTTVTDRAFYFSCSSSAHYPAPHYATLPYFIPHQDHACPPCQVASIKNRSMREAIAEAKAAHPHLTAEMLVIDNKKQNVEMPSLEQYVDEKMGEEKQFWFCRIRKWEQDLKTKKVLVSEEDGLSLFGDR